MQDFIQMAKEKLNVSEEAIRTATGGVLKIVQNHVSASLFQQITDKIPGAHELVQQAPPTPAPVTEEAPAGPTSETPAPAEVGSGMFGNLMGDASSMMSGLMNKASGMVGDIGAAASVMGVLHNAGMDLTKAGAFISLFFNYLKEQVGTEKINQVLDRVPFLKHHVEAPGPTAE